jgi:hypothetical protein
MADPQRAAQLVTDDALTSRGLVSAPDIVLATDERELHGNGFEPLAAATNSAGEYELTTASSRKGKARYADSEDDTAAESSDHYDSLRRNRDDNRGHAGYRASIGTDAGSHARGGSYSRIELGDPSRGLRGLGPREPEKLDERTLQIMWWRSAAINVLYILAW